MFENEVQGILNRQAETENLLKELHNIYEPYHWGSKRDSIFYVDIRIDHPEKPEHIAKEYLRQILQNRELGERLRGQKCDTVNELAELIQGTSINDFYISMTKYLSHCYNPKEYEIGNMEYRESRVHDRKLELILNCIWLLDHSEPIDREMSRKIYKLAENGETFIFLGCKVTRYKNGNLKIKFTNAKLFSSFEDRFNKALKKAAEGVKE